LPALDKEHTYASNVSKYLALAAVAFARLGAGAVIPTSAVAYYDEYDYCSNPSHDPLLLDFLPPSLRRGERPDHDQDSALAIVS
jgi:hypothetical protein